MGLPNECARERTAAISECRDAPAGIGDSQRQTYGLPPRAATAQSRPCRWYAPAHICTGTALTPATSASGLGLTLATSEPGLRSPLPHLPRDLVPPAHIHLRADLMYLQRGWAHPAHICRESGPRSLPCHILCGTRQLFVPGEIGGKSFMAQDPPIFLPCDHCLGTNQFLCESGASLYAHKPRQALSHACAARTPVGAS